MAKLNVFNLIGTLTSPSLSHEGGVQLLVHWLRLLLLQPVLSFWNGANGEGVESSYPPLPLLAYSVKPNKRITT